MKQALLYSCVLFIVLSSACPKSDESETNGPDIGVDKLVSEDESGLSKAVYDAIANDPRPSIAEKNKLLTEIRTVINKDIKSQVTRDKAIDDVVASHGDFVGLNTMLKININKDYPILSPLILLKKPFGLSQEIYDAITTSNESAPASIGQKNEIIVAVNSAMLILPKEQNTRDVAIDEAVKINGNFAGLAAVIKAAANKSDPIPVVLLNKPGTMDDSIYYEIKYSALTNEDKNTLIQGVDDATRARPQDRKVREQAIRSLVLSVGNPSNLADKLINLLEPIVPLVWRGTMAQSVFDAITVSNEAMPANNEEKNKIKKAVDAALNHRPQDQATRNTDIEKAVQDNGNYPNLANVIINEVNKSEPINALIGLPTGMDQKVYDAITKSPESKQAKNTEKNAIIQAVDAAMKVTPKVQATRDAAIGNSVASNGNYPSLDAVIKIAVDEVDPIGGAGANLTRQPTDMPFQVYNEIAWGPHTALIKTVEKNEIILGVAGALRYRPQDQGLRDLMIGNAMKSKYPDLKKDVIKLVNIAEPIVPIINQPVGMSPAVWTAIGWSPESLPAKNAEKNAIILAVNAAMKATPKNQTKRDLAIDNAVLFNGNYPNLASIIKFAVDEADPI